MIPGESKKLFNLALKAPQTTFVFTHLGGMDFHFWNILKAATLARCLA